jgi:hypothetical protein
MLPLALHLQSELEDCKCTGGTNGDPYSALTKGEPEDKKGVSRYTLLNEGSGHTIFEIAELQKTIGVCICTGRKNADPKKHHA